MGSPMLVQFVALTGGPGGGKTTLIRDLACDPAWRGRFLALPEAIFTAGQVGIPVRERRFQHLMVETQCGLEDALARVLAGSEEQVVLCHRGALDPLAYWIDRGWPEEAFFSMIGRDRQALLERYAAVIHLVTAADGAVGYYTRWPHAHRPERPEDAVRLDDLLGRIWKDHPRYHRLENDGCDWPTKRMRAVSLLEEYRDT